MVCTSCTGCHHNYVVTIIRPGKLRINLGSNRLTCRMPSKGSIDNPLRVYCRHKTIVKTVKPDREIEDKL